MRAKKERSREELEGELCGFSDTFHSPNTQLNDWLDELLERRAEDAVPLRRGRA